MKKIAILAVLLVFVFGFVTMTEVVAGDPIPGAEVTVYNSVDNTPHLDDNARAYISGHAEGACNKKVWEAIISARANIAQWVDWEFENTRWDWYVRKPGDYYANSFKFKLSSNGDVAVTFADFDDLGYLGQDGVKETIDTYYFAGLQRDIEWIRADELECTHTFEDSAELHAGLEFKLWNRIDVTPCNSASSYANAGKVTITLQNQKDFIDDDGNWVNLPPMYDDTLPFYGPDQSSS